MAMPSQPWRDAMAPASFRGASFHVQSSGQSGGRRGPTHEFPNRDVPFSEDLGRRARRWPVTGYCIGPGYIAARDALIAACEASGAATLVHPTLGQFQAKCDTYSVTEDKDRGGVCVFQMAFSEAGSLSFAASTDTQAAAAASGNKLGQTVATSLNTSLANANGGSNLAL